MDTSIPFVCSRRVRHPAYKDAFPCCRPGLRPGVLIVGVFLFLPLASQAYPEFQQDIVKRTHRPVNCAYCHQHSDGPEGTAPGQIGALTSAELERLGRARAAMEPGTQEESPILNGFGNHMVKSLGKKKIVELRLVPDQVGDALSTESDLDEDGISDAAEYRDGTHPGIFSDGKPLKLLRHNLLRHRGPVLLTLVATIMGLYGIRHLLVAFARQTAMQDDETSEEESA